MSAVVLLLVKITIVGEIVLRCVRNCCFLRYSVYNTLLKTNPSSYLTFQHFRACSILDCGRAKEATQYLLAYYYYFWSSRG